MSCPDIEEIIDFAAREPRESDFDLALHLDSCPECREHFQEAHALVSCDCPLGIGEFVKARQAVAKSLEKKDELKDIISFIVKKLDVNPFLSLLTEKIPGLGAAPSMVFASSGTGRVSAADHPPRIYFSAKVPAESPLYWRAELQLPALLTAQSSMDILVTDGKCSPVPRAQLYFREIPLDVCNGRTQISFDNFKKSAQGQGIFVRFPDNSCSEGDIEFL